MLSSTSDRDRDQVVSRWVKREAKRAKAVTGNFLKAAEPHNILMVDQLWLWYIPSQNDSEPDTVITCFPSRKGVQHPMSREVDDLQANVLRSHNTHPRDLICNASNLVSRILTVCCGSLDRHQPAKSVDFMQMFQSTIGEAVSKISR